MGKRKGRRDTGDEHTLAADEIGENGEEFEGGKGAGFFACYLLTSVCPRFKGHTYIGYTLNPRRRIRQHNGEIGCGAWRTKRKRPWEMVLCIYGFPTNVAALQFEWAWQHPVESLAVRNAAASFKSLSGLANKIKMAYTMLTLPAWQSLNLTVNLFSTKYQQYTSACPALPDQMRTQICSMNDLPCYNVNACSINDEWNDNERECSFEAKEKESTEAEREIHNSPSYDSTREEHGHQQINHIDDGNFESGGCLASSRVEWPSPLREEDRVQRSFIIDDSPSRISFSNGSPGLVELTREFHEPLDNQSTTILVAEKEKNRPDDAREVEIIDVFTPSPCCRGSKKTTPTLCPQIIDLTNSPMYV